MPKHATMNQPLPRIVESAGYLAAFSCLGQCRVAHVPRRGIGADLVKMVTVQVNAVRKRGVIDQQDPRGLASLKSREGGLGQTRDTVEGTDVVSRVPAAHGCAFHGELQPSGFLGER